MKTKQVIGEIGKLIHSFIYIIGCMEIWQYTFEHWPRGTHLAIGVALAAFAIWYLWSFFVRPFRSGMRGESQ
jgi:hypothetical protein